MGVGAGARLTLTYMLILIIPYVKVSMIGQTRNLLTTTDCDASTLQAGGSQVGGTALAMSLAVPKRSYHAKPLAGDAARVKAGNTSIKDFFSPPPKPGRPRC